MLRITCTGRLGSDVKIIETTKEPFIAFNVAEITGRDKTPQWLDCTMSYDRGNLPPVTAYLKKGKTVLIEGRPYVKAYVDKDGVAAASLGVFVSKIELLDKKEGE